MSSVINSRHVHKHKPHPSINNRLYNYGPFRNNVLGFGFGFRLRPLVWILKCVRNARANCQNNRGAKLAWAESRPKPSFRKEPACIWKDNISENKIVVFYEGCYYVWKSSCWLGLKYVYLFDGFRGKFKESTLDCVWDLGSDLMGDFRTLGGSRHTRAQFHGSAYRT